MRNFSSTEIAKRMVKNVFFFFFYCFLMLHVIHVMYECICVMTCINRATRFIIALPMNHIGLTAPIRLEKS